ncbi:hypothetical protein [Rhizobium sp. RU36D]|uniref:VHL beta domain-containing protein n=1 Tax=Rhizobium sp. RU36D TaxID=1907415 RepID=UPI0009D8AB2B|nr:hypothetical protein [Rhizobium sp. RU36D]SMD08418.1 von Hippel-Lindau disease tumour suppressor protein [Rhizobium sp. RU36D]
MNTRLLLNAVALTMLMLPASPSQADECLAGATSSPETNIPTGIRFHNDTAYAFRVYWADFKGQLREYALVQPGEEPGFKTYVHHRWFVEIFTPAGTFCAGPVSAPDTETCDMRVLFDNHDPSVGLDGGYCDY